MRNLVVVRAGDSSLHETWLAGDRQWDMIVSYYGDDPQRFRRQDVPRTDFKGGKFEGLYAAFEAQPELLKSYDYIWLPDDDLATDCTVINRMFAVTAEHRLSIAQPSLAPQSYVAFPELMRNPEFLLRYTDFVESMMPCFEARFLASIVHLFAGLRFGWYLDKFWARMVPEPKYRSAIIDACEVNHTRAPGSGSLYQLGDQQSEGKRISRVLGPVPGNQHMVYGGIDKEGNYLRRGPTFAWRSLKGIKTIAPRITGRWAKPERNFLYSVMKRHLIYRNNICQISIPSAFP